MTEIVPYLPNPVHGPSPRALLAEIVNAILYKLKTGVQWHLLPVSELFSGEPLHYKTRASAIIANDAGTGHGRIAEYNFSQGTGSRTFA